MNARLFSLLLAAPVVFVGCSENSPLPTEPAGASRTQAVTAPNVPASREPAQAVGVSHTIHEDVVLDDPVQSKNRVEVVGNVFWEVSPSPVLGRNGVEVALMFDGQAALLRLDGPMRWKIGGKDTRRVDLSSKDVVTIEESYAVLGSPEPMTLHVRYFVKEREVQVNDLWLTSAAVVR
jgi:hypothetical protein